jgi:hypothetical protein
MGARVRDALEKAAVVAFYFFVGTFVISAWQAGWPGEEFPMQPWAVAIAIPAIVLMLVGSIAASGSSEPRERD